MVEITHLKFRQLRASVSKRVACKTVFEQRVRNLMSGAGFEWLLHPPKEIKWLQNRKRENMNRRYLFIVLSFLHSSLDKKGAKGFPKREDGLGIDIPLKGTKIRMVRSKGASHNTSKKFTKWPYFTIWTAPSTAKSKHVRTNTSSGIKQVRKMNKKVQNVLAIGKPRTRTNSKQKHRKTASSINKAKKRDLVFGHKINLSGITSKKGLQKVKKTALGIKSKKKAGYNTEIASKSSSLKRKKNMSSSPRK